MKKLFFIVMISYGICVIAQTLQEPINLNTYKQYEIPNNVYIKDLNNAFAPYIGDWESVFEGKTILFKIQKLTHLEQSFPDGSHYYQDMLIIKYRVTDIASGVVLASTLEHLNPNTVSLSSVGVGIDINDLIFQYYDVERCNFSASISLIRNGNNSNQLFYKFESNENFIDPDCPFYNQGVVNLPVPKTDVVFTRVN